MVLTLELERLGEEDQEFEFLMKVFNRSQFTGSCWRRTRVEPCWSFKN